MFEPCDVAISAAPGDVLGPPDQTVSIIRKFVKPGGYMIISDSFIKEGGPSDFPEFELYAGRAAMIARLTACGHILIREIFTAAICGRNKGDKIAACAEVIAVRQPEIATEVLSYAEQQAAEYGFMDENFTCAVWVLTRSR
ncbi:MAG: hypothetical protein OEM25_09115 [Gammaproteobacteria bacterium]|nr:hypothetical protein [Gammaproteobacteria bacterium]